MSAGESRAVPFHCPYCGDENLRPSETGHGAWECHACLRAFSLKMLGMIPRPSGIPSTSTSASTSTGISTGTALDPGTVR